MAVTLKVGTWNVNNFFDRFLFHLPAANAARSAWRVEARWRKPRPDREKQYLADRLLAEDPDVMGLQEVESASALQEFNRRFLRSRYPYRVLIPSGDSRGLDSAVLSKFPVGRCTTRQHLGFLDSTGRVIPVFSRDMLGVEILNSSATSILLTICVLHLKSKFVGYRVRGSARRRAQLEAARKRRRESEAVREELKKLKGRVLILGDLNDDATSRAVQPLTRSRALVDISQKAASPRWTIRHAGQPHRFDYLLANPSLARKYVAGSAHVERTRGKYKASDHHPVYAAFRI